MTATYGKRRATVHGSTMAYLEAGAGAPIVFLHGNPTSSCIRRDIIDHVARLGRCIAPDLIGMGDSDKLEPAGPGSYRFADHRRYLHGLLEEIGASDKLVLVGQDWGSGARVRLGQSPSRPGQGHFPHGRDRAAVVAGAVALPPDQLQLFLAIRSPAGEELILEHNAFVENVIPEQVMRTLSDEEMEKYRRPFRAPGEGRRPTLSWPREIPFEGEPADVHEIVSSYAHWLARSDVPKLFINVEPGFIVDDDTRVHPDLAAPAGGRRARTALRAGGHTRGDRPGGGEVAGRSLLRRCRTAAAADCDISRRARKCTSLIAAGLAHTVVAIARCTPRGGRRAPRGAAAGRAFCGAKDKRT
jgi:haloalkane dehalogenase